MGFTRKQGQGIIYPAIVSQPQHVFGNIQIFFQITFNIDHALFGIARNTKVSNLTYFTLKLFANFIESIF